MAFHGRNSGDEALLLTPQAITGVPQDESENGTTDHIKGGVYFGLEVSGESYGGAKPGETVSEIAWFYGEAGQACFWVSEKGPPHTEGPYKRVPATINHFAQFEDAEDFFGCCGGLQRMGEREVLVEGLVVEGG